jgi:hypothetical protein
MTEVTLAVLLQMFSQCCTGAARPAPYPFRPEVTAIAQRTPTDPDVYVRFADEAFSKFLGSPDAVDLERFADFEEVMRILLFYDGRSARGLIRIADLSFKNPDISNAGVNALAWLSNFLRMPQSRISAQELHQFKSQLEQYAENRTLAHNARACLDALEERR